ncbi:Sporulation-specific protein [Actinidia chinensis var. chinensis]|uniref:Sporulation-specific protein n=1 Tax=Actinidia chinensis var. chinensis TaxID=1590841 RepID=A0A2R6RNQ8_ACTCC|nr:Sporulation-specific protein [Actinidia chinensis var. chinensis]
MKPSIVALPLHGCDSGTVLHVAIQLLTSKTGFREFEQQRELRERGLQTGTDQNRHEGFGTGKVSSSVEFTNDQTDKVNARVRFRPESKDLPSLEEEVGLTEEYADSAAGFDGSSNTSESLCAEKHDNSSAHEIDSQKSMVSGDLNGLSHCQSPREEKGDTSDNRILAHGSIDSVHGWSSDYSIDNDLAIAYEENNRLRGCLEVAESSILELKLEVSSLQNHADEIGIEARNLSQQFAAEITSGEELVKEVSVMKSECSKLKGDLEELKSLKLSPQFASRETSNSNQDHLFQGIQIRWLKGLLAVEDKIRKFQNKLYLGFHDRDLMFLHSELEALLIFLQGLKQGTEETSCLLSIPSEMTNIKEISEITSRESEQFISGNGFDVDLYQPPDMLHCLSIPSMVSQETDLTGATIAMKGKIFELLRELDESKAERESLARKMDQMECYYEALIQELEQNQKQMLGELQNLRNEHSACLYTIATTSAEMESMRQDMNDQILRFTEERRDLDSINMELESRAITSEAALRRARLNYSIAVNQLQKDLDLLSSQVLSMFETNENLIKQTVSETSQPFFLGNPDAVQNPEESDASKLLQYQNQNAGGKKQVLGGDLLLEDMKNSLLLQEGLYLKVEEELSEMHVANVHLDVFSKILQETLLEASADIVLAKKTIEELAQKMDLSTASKKLLMLQLKTAMDDVQALNEYKASCTAKCSDMDLQNQILVAKFEGLSNENCLLTKKIAEWESLMREYRSYESKYKACFDEKTEMANLLKQETLNKANLQNEVSYLQEELKTVKAEQSELAYSKENLQKTVSFLEDRLGSLGESYHKKFYGLFPLTNSVRHDRGSRDFVSVIPQLEEFQHNACEKILQLLEEKKILENERDLAHMFSNTASSEIRVLKQQFKHDVQNMATKLEAVSGLVEKFQLELETLANKLHISCEAEEKYAHQNEELSADIALLEAELQQLTSKNMDLAKDILGFDTLTEELGRSKLIIGELTRERDLAQMSSSTASSDILVLKQKFKHDVQNMATKLEAVNGLVEKFQLKLETLANKLHISCEAEEKYAHQNEELLADLALLEVELKQVTSKNMDLAKEILGLDTLTEELGRSKLIIGELTQERQDLMMSLQDKTEESVKLSSELNNLKERLRFLHDELNVERSCRSKLEGNITDLTSQLNEKNDHLLQFSQQEAELAHFRQLASDLQLEKSSVCHILQQREECLEKLREDSSQLTDLESQSSELHEYVIAADVKFIFIRTQYETQTKEYALNLQSLEKHLGELRKKLFDIEVMLNRSLTGEAHCIEENANLVNTVDSLRSELKASVAQNGVLSELNSIKTVQLEECKKRVAELEVNCSNDKNEHSLEVEKLKHMLVFYQEEIDELMSSKEEMEITVTVLKAKLDELHAHVTSLEESYDELLMLRNQCNELTHKLSEQILKTEEFKNLSIHLKELKDHAEAECLQARQKREHEGPSGVVQESLRIAFIKEQYETRLQELRQQLSVSKKHGEDMLWKLQDSVDELENRKKSEASHLKRNEELALKILELEAELQSLVSEKREKIKAYDRTTAELECALLSLECCKEENKGLKILCKNAMRRIIELQLNLP